MAHVGYDHAAMAFLGVFDRDHEVAHVRAEMWLVVYASDPVGAGPQVRKV